MCLGAEAAWVPALISAAGAGVGAVNQAQTLRQQDRDVARGIRSQMALSQQANQRVAKQIQDTAKSSPDEEAAKADSDFVAALKRAKVSNGGADLSGPGGSRFQDDLGLARTAAQNEGSALSKQLAAIDAPKFQRMREGVNTNNAAIDLSMLDDRSKALDFLTRMKVASRRANPWVDALGQGLTAFGLAKAGQASKKPAGATGSIFNSLPSQAPPVTVGYGDGYNA